MNTATEVVAPRMQALQKLEKTLKKLDLSWKVIETTARVVSPPQVAGYIATLEHTRLAFSQLAAEMVEQIAHTHLQNCRHESRGLHYSLDFAELRDPPQPTILLPGVPAPAPAGRRPRTE